MSMHFVVVNPFTKSNNCQECGNIKVRDNDNRIIETRWISAPDISQHASETAFYCKVYYSICQGSTSLFSNIILIILKVTNVLSFLL